MTMPVKPASKRVSPAPSKSAGPLLAVDGDSFAHRSYHALPKTIRMAGNKPAGAIVGFANFLLRLFEAEQPRAVVVGWDTLEAPTYRHKAFPAYQSGRQFDKELLQQFPLLREFVSACGFINARAPGYEADDFLAAAVALAEKRRMKIVVASGDRDTFQLASESSTILYPVRAGELARIGPSRSWSAIACCRCRCPISPPCAATLPTACRAPKASAKSARPRCCFNTARWMES